MEVWEVAVVLGAGLVAGAVNAAAGGGTLIAYPALVWIGLDPVVANATSTLALWPGYVTATIGFRRDLAGTGRIGATLALPSLVGGLVGAYLLLLTPDRVFEDVVPFLILGATLLLLWQDRQERRDRRRRPDATPAPPAFTPAWVAGAVAFQLVAAVYGGYFGAGLGFMLLAGFGALGMREFLQATGLKNALTVLVNGVALAYFVARGALEWAEGLTMAVGALAGGFAGAALTRRVGGRTARLAVVLLGLAMTVLLFLRAS